jgi:hypothetical protein
MIQNVLLVMALTMAPAKADPVDKARKAYNNCLIETHNKAVDEKKSASAFRDAIGSACPTEKTAYHDLIVKAELGYKSKPADAEQFANEEVQAVIDYITGAFGENIDSGAKMTAEK